jgi:hypothetical protein
MEKFPDAWEDWNEKPPNHNSLTPDFELAGERKQVILTWIQTQARSRLSGVVGASPYFDVIPSNPAKFEPFFSDPFNLGEWSHFNEHTVKHLAALRNQTGL